MDIKKEFPIFKNSPFNWSYLDSAATTQKPRVVIQAVKEWYERGNSNVHRGDYLLARKATENYEASRSKVKNFIHADKEKEIIFTKNTNEGMTILAYNMKRFLNIGDVLILSRMEHNANVVPWLTLQKQVGFTIHWLDINDEGILQYSVPESILKRVKVVSLTHVSNVLGTINPLEEIFKYFRKNVLNPIVCIADGAQAIGHIPVDVKQLDCDCYAFSGHKMYAPSGVGVLFIREALHPIFLPLVVGSHMVSDVSENGYEINDAPAGMEAGTGNLEGVYGLGIAIDFLTDIGMEQVRSHEQELSAYAIEKFKELKCYLRGSKQSFNRIGIFSFEYDVIHPHDISQALDLANVCIRSGHHCSHILMKYLDTSGVARASFGLYTTKKDIDNLVKVLHEIEEFYHV